MKASIPSLAKSSRNLETLVEDDDGATSDETVDFATMAFRDEIK